MSVVHMNLRDCVEKCKSKQHGDLVCAALTKRAVSDYELCSYLDYLCCSCDTVQDDLGRTALHVAVSCGRSDMVKWLTRSKHANINSKDNESGYTPLHRSLFYGKIDIAVYLIKLGANLTLTDFNGYTGLEHAMHDCKELTNTCDVNKGEVYVWGSNTNYTLGTQQARLVPDLFDVFYKEYPQIYVKQVCLEKFHCVLVSKDGRVFASGHGHGGRLGFASDKTVIVPKEVKFVPRFQSHGVVITKASIALDHSVFLSESGHIWTCGLNTHHVLGIRPPPIHMLTPYQLSELQHTIKDVCAAKYHTVAWGSTAIYTWGLNAGQLGHDKSAQKYIVTPKLVTCMFGADYTILDVVSSNCAIAVLTSKGDIYVIHEYLCRKIVSKKLNITSLGIIGGKLTTKIDNCIVEENHELIITGLSNIGNVYVWKESDGQFCRCIYSINRFLKIRQVVLNLNEVLFVTYNGEAFKGTFKARKRRNTESNNSVPHSGDFHDFLEKDNCQLLKVNRILRTHRAVSISSDWEGRNFAVLQTNPQEFLTKLPTVSESSIQEDMLNFLNETSEIDSVHDVIFKVSPHLFPAHSYIISTASTALNKLILASDEKIIELSNIDHLIFEQILIFIYTGTCDLLKIGKCPEKLRGLAYDKKDAKNKDENKKDSIKMLREAAKRFDILNLFKRLGNLYMDDEFIMSQASISATIKLKFDINSFPELKTVVLKTKDGKDILAHKCILAARMEYFNNLFSVRWTEVSSKTQIPFPYSYHLIDQLLEYLYTDELSNLCKEDLDNVCNLLILADEFLMTRLKEICEHSLSLCVTIKNVVHLFLFACTYNAFQLKICCMEFICLNLTAILELKSLEIVDDQLLRDLTEFYCNYNPCMQQRIITPYSYAPSDETVLEIATMNPISMDESDTENNVKTNAKSQSKKRRSRKSGSLEFSLRKERQCSESDNKNVSISETEELCLPAVHSQEEKPFTQIQLRVKAITIAQDKLKESCIDNDYTILPLKQNATKLSLTDFPELESQNSGTCSKSFIKIDRVDSKHKMTRMSQKERKRLSSESSSNVIEPSSPLPIIGSPKNPWKILSEVDNTSPISSPKSAATMSSIMTDEKKLKENFIKMKTKLLLHTQIEDKAIDDLYKFYNVDNVTDEIITVNRVQIGLLASPVWVPIGKQKQ